MWCTLKVTRRELSATSTVREHRETGCVTLQKGFSLSRQDCQREHQVQRRMRQELLLIQHHHQQYLRLRRHQTQFIPSFSERSEVRDMQVYKDYKSAFSRKIHEKWKDGDVKTADYRVLNNDKESRLQQRDSVVVQDLATQWMRSYPCENKPETSQNSRRFVLLEADPKTSSSE